MGELDRRALRAKHQLSTMEITSVTVAANGKRLAVPITRAEFEALDKLLDTWPLIETRRGPKP